MHICDTAYPVPRSTDYDPDDTIASPIVPHFIHVIDSSRVLRTASSMEALERTFAWRYGVLARQRRREAALLEVERFGAALLVFALLPVRVVRATARGQERLRRTHPLVGGVLALLALFCLFWACLAAWLLVISLEQGRNAFLLLFSMVSGAGQ